MSKEKTMLGQRVVGYICVGQDEKIEEKNGAYIYINAADSLGIRENDEKPVIYEVEGKSTVKSALISEHGYYGRTYYICDDIKVIREITIEQIIERCVYPQDSIERVLAFYPLTEIHALKIAKLFKDSNYVLKVLTMKFPECKEIKELYEENCKAIAEQQKAAEEYHKLQLEYVQKYDKKRTSHN